MKVFTRIFYGLFIALVFLYGTTVSGQSILNPADSVLTYPANRPNQPANGTIGKWVRTVRMTWNTNLWKCYILNGNPFRLRFPKSYNPTANDGKQYPMLIFMHGEGEGGTVYDNEYSLFHGGNIFDTAVTNGSFDGYILVMQTTGGWGPAQMTAQQFIIDYMIKNNKLDPFRVTLNGLSGGGSGCWQLFQSKETYIAGLMPMSSVAIAFDSPDSVNKWKYEPIWNIHGGKDGSPAPYTATQVANAMAAAGANYIDLNMTTQGHDTWDSTWSMPAFWPWLLAQYCSNPWTLFGRTWFCPGQTINVTVGLQPGYQAYQWRKNGVVIAGATSNTINVTSLGTYDARVERNNIWSNWSPTPVVIQNPPATVTPPITIPALMSVVIPAPDGNTGVTLQEPTGYATYTWQKVGSSTSLATTNTYYANSPGQYIAEVTQQYGCATSFSAPYTVVNANGPNKPDPATGLVVTNLSSTSQKLNWNQNPNPNYQETNFEVYQGTQSGGPYKLIAINGPNVVSDTVTGLKPRIQYYYIVRAVNGTAAAANSNEASGATSTDNQAPTTPGNLTISSSTQSAINLSWTKSTDNVAVTAYNIYVNGALSNVTSNGTATTFTVTGLNFQQSYNFYITAVDAAGNMSPASNQVSGEPLIGGLSYSYFALTGTTTTMPNLTTRATSTGTLTNISLSPAGTRTTEFALLFNGFLHVTTAGTYTFQVTSSDGANVYLGALNAGGSPYSTTATPLINNNGVHDPATTATSANVNLSVGLYPIAVAYFQGVAGTPSLTLSWETPGSGTFVPIPTPGFTDTAVVNGQVPAIPTNLAATTLSFNKVSLSWTDNSSGKAATEIWRSTSATTGFAVVGTAAAGVSSFIDSAASPATTYYYKIKADNQYGESALTSAVTATTQVLPTIPAVPSGFAGQALSYSSLRLSWNAVANAASIVLQRSAVNDLQYVQWAVLPGTATSFTDTGLYANSTYYYKIQAVNPGGSSAFTPEIAVVTKDNAPVITKLAATVQAKYGSTTTIAVSATQPGTNTLTFKGFNLPSFATLVDNGNRTGTLTVTPTAANAGNYPGLYIVVSDAFGGADTTTFTLAVNNSTPPTLNAISNVTMNEGDTLTVALTGTNSSSPSDNLSFSATGGPARTVLTPVSNGSAKLFLQPSFAAGGVYTVQVTLNDQANGLSATQSFTVTVKNKNPNTTIYSRFAYNDAGALGLPWNALLGATTNNLKDSNGNVTTVGLTFSPTTWWNTYNAGSSTGNNSGVYPDVVLQDYYWFGSVYGGPDVINGTVSGADTSQLYDLTFFANSVYSGFGDNGTTTYTAGGQTVSLHVQNNTKNTVTISSLKAAANGTIPFSMGIVQTGQLGYINALVITKHFDDGTAPAGTSALTATNAPSRVTLNWTDSAYNATGYEVWRSLTGTGSYNLLGTAAGNSATGYIDSTVNSNTGYTYEVRAVNTHGSSAFDSVSTVTQRRLPKITAIQNVVMKDTSSLTINVTTSADPSAQLTLTAANLPPFATLTDNGNGTGVLTLSPSAGTTGIYSNVTITVADQYDSTASTSFSVAVTEPNVQSVYLSLSGGAVSPAPWNMLTTAPFQGTVLSNLKDDGGANSGVSATLLDGWYWFGLTGYVGGNGQGVYPTQSTYPPTVAGNFIYEPTTATRRIQFSGLNNAKQYNFVFYNSMWDGTNGLTWFVINNDSVSLQADWNVNKTIQLNGIRPVNGVITVGVHRAAAAANAYLSSIVLQAYDTTAGTLIGPADLRATRITQTTVSLQWQDRSAIETGYEVWRASDATGNYTLLASLPAKTTTYMDTKLSKNTNYYYIVRAINGSAQSNYSSVLAITTYQDAIYVHPSYTTAGNGPTPPWNNLNSSGRVGASWSNWIDSTGSTTSVGMTQTGAFAGPNSLGDVTGNNSGVYPDPILLQQYVLFPGNDGSFTVSGLTLSKTYDFTFFGTENYETGNQNTAYIVNGDTVYLNALYNQQTVITMYGVTPNAQGQVSLQMICQGTAIAGWFNAMVINGYTAIPRNAPTVPTVTGGLFSPVITGTANQFNAQSASALSMDSVIQAYPNPFHTSFTLSVPVFTTGEKVMVGLYDMAGRLVYRKEFDNVQQGMNYLQVGEDGSIGGPGVYLGKVSFGSGRAAQTIKLIKQ